MARTTGTSGPPLPALRRPPQGDALDGLPDGVLIMGGDLIIRYANPAASELLGWTCEELVGTCFEELIPPELIHVHRQARRSFLEGPVEQRVGRAWSRRPFLHRDGTYVPLSGSVAVAADPHGRRITVTLRAAGEVTSALRELEHLVISQRIARMGSWSVRPATGEVHWSRGLFELLGLTPGDAELSNEAFYRRIHPDDLGIVVAAREHGARVGGPIEVEFRLIRPVAGRGDAAPGSGEHIRVRLLGQVDLDADGKPVLFTCTLQEVMAATRLEIERAGPHPQVEPAFEHAPVGVAMVGVGAEDAGLILRANTALATMLGVDAARLVGRRLLDLVACTEPVDLSDGLGAGAARVGPVLVRIDAGGRGRDLWASITGALVPATDVRPGYYITHLTDVTQERLVREREQAAAARDARIARILQDDLMPVVPHRVGPAVVATRYRPAGSGIEVGGDWTDVFQLSDGRVGIVVGDVAGHGIASAVTMSQMRALVRMLAIGGPRPEEVMRRLNAALYDTVGLLDEIELVTVVHGQLDALTGVLSYSSAGHLPLISISPGHPAVPLPTAGGPPIGALTDYPFEQDTMRIEPGGRLVGYTDGLIERRGVSLDDALQSLVDRLGRLEPSMVRDVDTLADAVLAEAPASETIDDLAVIVVGLEPPPREDGAAEP
ncbi:MAG TPA: SpoIIE family protein phosphatase [Kineosporiaceae bacterium]